MMRFHFAQRFCLGALLLAGATVAVTHAEETAPAGPQPTADLPLDELRTFADVFGRIKEDYVEQADDRSLIESAIRGMLSGLDPHSSYLNAEEYRDLQVGTSGEFGGLGIEVGLEDGFVKVIAPIDDTPAQRAGLQAGDMIIRIDEKPIKGLGLDEAVKLMRGKPGTEIRLTIMRGTEQSPFDVTIERAIIQVASVKSRMLEPGFGYVRITSFQAHTTDDMQKAMGQLEKTNGGKLEGLILDLRNNPGGVLSGAVGVSDAFLTRGLIVYTQGRVKDSKMQFEAGPDDLLDGAPIVVLVNGGSASASEIVAGALQDHKRAIIMGTRTFGKGSVQTIVPIDDTTALKLTTARYYTPSGRSIQAQGIEPDIVLHPGEFKPKSDDDLKSVKEADLMRHLGEETEVPSAADEAQRPPEEEKANEEDSDSPTIDDFQLNEALNVLKGVTIFGSRKAGSEKAP
nr:S41 family peptidase [Imhoffiella purpurea]